MGQKMPLRDFPHLGELTFHSMAPRSPGNRERTEEHHVLVLRIETIRIYRSLIFWAFQDSYVSARFLARSWTCVCFPFRMQAGA
jgi:hypothetical protein